MTPQPYIVATAGHVDHGKSSLVKALTGIDPDRLPEEKARGITIDLGFAHLELSAPSTFNSSPSTKFHLGIIDVPGHEDFVKNMVVGVGSIDLALFVVAADDGWMPQTEEHLQILTYLGVRHAVVALTKIDLAQEAEDAVIERLREHLLDSPFAKASIVPTSVVNGRGIEEMKSALVATLAYVPPPLDIQKPRLPIDRAFTLHGIGTVVTGTLNGGVLKRNQSVVLRPSGKPTRIRTVQSHNREVEHAVPGTRTALNLPDFPLASASHEGVARGQVVTVAELGDATTTIDVVLDKSGRLRGQKVGAARPLKDGALVRLHHGSANTAARVRLHASEPLLPGQQTLARLRLEEPMFVLAGDRFILRDWPEQLTLAGGVVLDLEASRSPFHGEAQQRFLRQRAQALDDASIWTMTLIARDHAVRRDGALQRSRFSSDAVAMALRGLLDSKTVGEAGGWLVLRGWWQEIRAKTLAAVESEHVAHPERSGLALTALRALIEPELPAPELFDALISELSCGECRQTGSYLRHRTHRPALPTHLQAPGAKLRAALSAKPFEPPSRKDLTPDQPSHQALQFLVNSGEAVDVNAELVMSSEAFGQAREVIVRFIQEHAEATASDLRQLLNTSRRIIIPLLEKLDKEGVTQRKGDVRILRTR